MNKLNKTTIAFLKATTELRAILNQTKNNDLSFSNMSLLMIILEHQNATLSDVAGFVNITNASASSFVQKMKESGYLEKKENILDKRSVIIQVTKLGKEKIKEKQKKAVELIAPFFKKLSKKELKNLFLILSKLFNK